YVQEKMERQEGRKGYYRYRYGDHLEEQWKVIKEVTNRFLEQIKIFLSIVDGLSIQEKHHHIYMREWLSILDMLKELQHMLYELIYRINQEEVMWMEVDVKGTFHSLCVYCQPISITEIIQEKFFQQKKSVVLTSATLTVNNEFTYIRNTLGLADNNVKTYSIPSPFSYQEAVRLFIPTDIASVKDISTFAYAEEIGRYITEIAMITEGKMLVLFTSQEMLQYAYRSIKEKNTSRGFLLLAQGISNGSKTRLMKQFQKHKKPILLGTTSFWEGIDIPGDTLQCLVIVRLPFLSPDMPMSEAKTQSLEKQGKNSFYEYSLPQAIIRFKQ